MKIENIIEDIKNDLQELKAKLEQQFRENHPSLDFSIALPGLEDLSAVKTMALVIVEPGAIHYLSVQIHTHNGNRLFENASKKIMDDQLILSHCQHPYQSIFVFLLRDIIKRKKKTIKSVKW
jgi:hypothetical protein